MQLTNCQQCGTLFYRYGTGRRCPSCIQAEEDAFRTVRAHIQETRERSIPRIAEATGVDRKLIIRWLRQKRLLVEAVPGELHCRRCGVSVAGGNFCENCRHELADEVEEQRRLVRQVAEGRKSKQGMHYRRASRDES